LIPQYRQVYKPSLRTLRSSGDELKHHSKIIAFSTVLFAAVASGGLIHTQIMYHGCGPTGSATPPIAQDLADRDTHLEIVRTLDDSGPTRRLIVEVKPRLRAIALGRGLDWSTPALQTLIGHRVKIRGWMLFDFEHVDESENTAPKRRDNWRATAWEIHPVTDITVLN
jgi:hypothetical protein